MGNESLRCPVCRFDSCQQQAGGVFTHASQCRQVGQTTRIVVAQPGFNGGLQPRIGGFGRAFGLSRGDECQTGHKNDRCISHYEKFTRHFAFETEKNWPISIISGQNENYDERRGYLH